MMAAKSLASQIKDAEWQVLTHQRDVDLRAATLVHKIHQQMTAPATLLLAGGIGFIIGELTKRQTPKSRGAADKPKPHAAATTPLRTALNLMASVQTLYTAFPIAWMMKSCYQPGASAQAPKRKFHHPVAGSSRRRSNR